MVNWKRSIEQGQLNKSQLTNCTIEQKANLPKANLPYRHWPIVQLHKMLIYQKLIYQILIDQMYNLTEFYWTIVQQNGQLNNNHFNKFENTGWLPRLG